MRIESEEDREQKNKTIYELNVKRLKTEKESRGRVWRAAHAPLAADPLFLSH